MNMNMNRLPSRLISALCVIATFACVISTSHAQRAIPTTDANEQYFNTILNIKALGALSSENCEASQQEQLIACIDTCNSPGKVKRGNCCCSTSRTDNANINVAFFGIASSCRYRQQLLNYSSDLIVYESRPLDGPPLYVDDSCEAVEEGDGTCSCSLRWSVKWSVVQPVIGSPSAAPGTSQVPVASPIPFTSIAFSPLPSISSPSTVFPATTASAASEPTPEQITPIPSGTMIPSQVGEASPSSGTNERETQFPAPTVTPSVGATSETETQGPAVTVTPTVSSVSDVNPPVVPPTGEAALTPSASAGTDGTDGTEADPSTTPGNEDEDTDDGNGGVCVDERYLQSKGFSKGDLVHKNGFLSKVYCPQHEGLPCGTAFHKVEMKDGSSLSYQQLCDQENMMCKKDVMTVNSVWTDKWENVEHGKVLLTMYDVRYPERAQRTLHRVMRSVRRINM